MLVYFTSHIIPIKNIINIILNSIVLYEGDKDALKIVYKYDTILYAFESGSSIPKFLAVSILNSHLVLLKMIIIY